MQAKHRRIRRWAILWLVRAWAARWCALHRRKQARAVSYQAALERDGLPESDRAALEACVSALDEAGSQEARSPAQVAVGQALRERRAGGSGWPLLLLGIALALRAMMGRWPALCAGGLPKCAE